MTQSTREEPSFAEYQMGQARKAVETHGGTLVHWSTPLDNYEPARAHATGYGVCYIHKVTQEPGFKFWPGDQLRDITRAILILDDGKVAAPYYCAGWNSKDETNGYVLFQPFPTNPHGRTRPDTGQPADYSGWVLGPRRAYHLKLVSVPNGVAT
jgi:hypothetical protein